MRIYSSRRDDLIAERNAYDAETSRLQGIVDEGEGKWREASNAQEDDITQQVLDAIGPTSLDLTVYARSSWRDRGYEVTVEANRHSRSENAALSWNIDVKLDDEGNVVKESSSWSGLKATTPAQIDDLKESVRVIELVNAIDWKPIIDVALPKFADYIDPETRNALRSRQNNRPDYDSMLENEDLNDAIESGKWIVMEGRPETAYYRGSKRGEYYGRVIKQSDKFVTVNIVGLNTVHSAQQGDEYAQQRLSENTYAEKIGKANFLRHVKKPIETVDINF